MGFLEVFGWVRVGAKLLRKLKLRKLVVHGRNSAIQGPIASLHDDFVHSLRKMEMAIGKEDFDGQGGAAIQVCNACKTLFMILTELPKNQINCSIKLMTGDIKDEAQVVTWSRSELVDGRDDTWSLSGDSAKQDRSLASHSAGAAIYGLKPWKHRFPCFTCNDLTKYPLKFHCSRQDWEKYYRSILVFPIQYARNEMGTDIGCVGFLCIDSPERGAFLGMPDIFDFAEPSSYRDSLERHMCFHMGALCADLLGAVLRNSGSSGSTELGRIGAGSPAPKIESTKNG